MGEQDAIREIVNHHGWKHVRQKFFDKLLSLQNSFEIDMTRTPTTIAKDLAVRRQAHEVLTEFWQDVEGTALQAEENKSLTKGKSYIYKKED